MSRKEIKCNIHSVEIGFDDFELDIRLSRNNPEAREFIKSLLDRDNRFDYWILSEPRPEPGNVDVDRLRDSVKGDQ